MIAIHAYLRGEKANAPCSICIGDPTLDAEGARFVIEATISTEAAPIRLEAHTAADAIAAAKMVVRITLRDHILLDASGAPLDMEALLGPAPPLPIRGEVDDGRRGGLGVVVSAVVVDDIVRIVFDRADGAEDDAWTSHTYVTRIEFPRTHFRDCKLTDRELQQLGMVVMIELAGEAGRPK